MEQPAYFPTGTDELDLSIMKEMDDVTLAGWCSVNVELHNLCDDESFWKERSQLYRSKLLRFVDRYPSWRKFYASVLDDVVYLVSTPHSYQATFIDPKKAYVQLVDDLIKGGLTIEEIVTGTRPEGFGYDGLYQMLLVLRNKTITPTNYREHTLFSFGREEELATVDINDYPVTRNNEPLLILYILGGIVEIKDLTSAELAKTRDDMIWKPRTHVSRVVLVVLAKPGNRSIDLELTSYGFSFLKGTAHDLKRYEIIDLSKLSNSKEFALYEMKRKDLISDPYMRNLSEPQFYQWSIKQERGRPLSDIFSL